MNKEKYKEISNATIDTNYETLSSLLERGLVIFEVDSVKKEIVNCLMLNLFQASIALTNHLLERGLKLALIHNVVGIVPVPIAEWSTKLPEPNKKYGSLDLYNAIEICAKESLVLDEEIQFLKNNIREQLRNGFSHADMSQILKDFPTTGTFMVGTFSSTSKIEPIELPQTQIHVLQPVFQESFARKNALPYFKYVYKLLINIEKRLQDKFKNLNYRD